MRCSVVSQGSWPCLPESSEETPVVAILVDVERPVDQHRMYVGGASERVELDDERRLLVQADRLRSHQRVTRTVRIVDRNVAFGDPDGHVELVGRQNRPREPTHFEYVAGITIDVPGNPVKGR